MMIPEEKKKKKKKKKIIVFQLYPSSVCLFCLTMVLKFLDFFYFKLFFCMFLSCFDFKNKF
jgi:hypothetical protein